MNEKITGNSDVIKRRLELLFSFKPKKFKKLVKNKKRLRFFCEMINSRDYGSINSIEITRLLDDSINLAMEVPEDEIDEYVELFHSKKFSSNGELNRPSSLHRVNVCNGFDFIESE